MWLLHAVYMYTVTCAVRVQSATCMGCDRLVSCLGRGLFSLGMRSEKRLGMRLLTGFLRDGGSITLSILETVDNFKHLYMCTQERHIHHPVPWSWWADKSKSSSRQQWLRSELVVGQCGGEAWGGGRRKGRSWVREGVAVPMRPVAGDVWWVWG